MHYIYIFKMPTICTYDIAPQISSKLLYCTILKIPVNQSTASYWVPVNWIRFTALMLSLYIEYKMVYSDLCPTNKGIFLDPKCCCNSCTNICVFECMSCLCIHAHLSSQGYIFVSVIVKEQERCSCGIMFVS